MDCADTEFEITSKTPTRTARLAERLFIICTSEQGLRFGILSLSNIFESGTAGMLEINLAFVETSMLNQFQSLKFKIQKLTCWRCDRPRPGATLQTLASLLPPYAPPVPTLLRIPTRTSPQPSAEQSPKSEDG